MAKQVDFPQTGIVRPAQVVAFLNVPRTTFYRWLKEGKFPRGRQWGSNQVWDAEQIRQIVRELHGPAANSRRIITCK